MRNRMLLLQQLDSQLKKWQPFLLIQRPKGGWVRTVRKALGMTTLQLAKKLELTRGRIVQLEHAETEDAVTLHTLRSVAAAMDCELIYAIIPKRSLKEMLEERANTLATEWVKHTSHSMALESQMVEEKKQKEQILQLAKSLLEGNPKKLWET